MNNVDQVKITSNDETFTRGTYNDISVIIRDADGFINASKMCDQFNKRFRKLFENHAWQAYLEEFKKEYEVRPETGGPIYELKKGYTNEIRGSYVHPNLINYIAFWSSPKYAVYVGKIMDLINEKNRLSSKTLEDTIEDLKQQNDELRTQLGVKDERIDELIPRTVKRGREHDYRIMVYKSNTTTDKVSLTFVRRSKKTWKKIHEDIRASDNCLFFADNLQMARTTVIKIFDQITEQLNEKEFTIVNKTITVNSQYVDRIIEITQEMVHLTE